MNKCEETWEYLKGFDTVGLRETWVDEEGWKKIENKLPTRYEWECIPAIRKRKRGRNKGGVMMAITKELKIDKKGKLIKE